MNEITNYIPVRSIDKFNKNMDKIVRKCKKLNLASPTITIGPKTIKEVECKPIYDMGFETFFDIKTYRTTVKIEVFPVTVNFDKICLPGGWKVLASIEYGAEGWNIINGKLDNLADYKQMKLRCDHCKVNRFRKKVVIVENSNGDRKVVGTNCVMDYMGVPLAAAIYSCDLANLIDKMCQEMSVGYGDGEEQYGNRSFRPITVELAALACAYVMRNEKWIYRKAGFGEGSTTTSVAVVLGNLMAPTEVEREKMRSKLTEVDLNNAKKFLEKMKAKYPESKLAESDQSFDYMNALMLKANMVWKLGIFVGSFCYLISQEMKGEIQKINPALSEFIGKVGDKKVALDIVWDRFKWIESNFSEDGCLICSGHIVDTNNMITWFCNGGDSSTIEYKDGVPQVNERVVKITATIKAHKDEGQYGKKTIIKMVKERA